jgi:hypothetical protein
LIAKISAMSKKKLNIILIELFFKTRIKLSLRLKIMMKMLKAANKAPCSSSCTLAQKQSIFAPPIEKHEAPIVESRVSFSLADIDIFPRESVQPKLKLGPVGDRYEQEADRVASKVVETISSPYQDQVQREYRCNEDDELDLDEDERLRRKVAGFLPAAGGADVGPDLDSAIRRARGGGQPLSDRVRQPMERAFGADFGGVRVHADTQADRLNRSIQARAFTTGQDIFLRQGEFRPGSSEGQRLLAHELTHVVQQNGETLKRDNGKRSTAELDCGLLETDVSFARYASTIQRYVLVNVGTSVVVNAIPGSVGPLPREFEAQQPPGMGQLGQVLVAGNPLNLRVSEDGRMAIEDSNLSARQPKVFYAEPAVWNDGNNNLTQSHYELYSDRDNAIRITIDGTTHNLDRVLARVKVVPPGVARTATQEGVELNVDLDCIMVATSIIGQPVAPAMVREAVIAGGVETSRDFGEYRTAAAMLEWAAAGSWSSNWIWPTPWWHLLWTGTNAAKTNMAMEKFRAVLGGGPGMQEIAKQYALLKRNQPILAEQVAQSLGVNVHAQPRVGEAYESYQIGLPTNLVSGPGPDWEADPTGATMASLTIPAGPGGAMVRHGWGQHIGAVVAMSDDNRVTLENYARSHELGDMRIGPDYYFQMYGPPRLPDQTWHHAWTAGAIAAHIAPVKNAVTIVVRQ